MVFYPFENLKVRFQCNDGALNNPVPEYLGIRHAFKTMYGEEGFKTLYRGVYIHFIGNALASGIFFFVYGYGKKHYDLENKSPFSPLTLWISALAGIASAGGVTPIWVLKTRIILYRNAEN
jgi:hypothetical protein